MLNETKKSDVNYLTTCSSHGYTARERETSCSKTSVGLDTFASKCLNYGKILDVVWNILTEETSPGLDHILLCEALLSLVSCRLRQALPFTESSWKLQEGDRSIVLAQHSHSLTSPMGRAAHPRGTGEWGQTTCKCSNLTPDIWKWSKTLAAFGCSEPHHRDFPSCHK